MNKKELVTAVAEKCSVTTEIASSCVNSVFATIEDSLNSSEKVTIFGFGTFETKHRAARRARNIKTGEVIDVPEKDIVSFKPSKSIKTVK
ncbi:DNA-binding protein HU [bioreactor metagenome]|uniref:DNA-binding protein HU n=1 Tax=bioreactor metagenome TaxID=1076179 RepID=A0A645CGD7_9ZZZZ|nr:HU family DNA-binding protein [Oscillospiraceae bacterium]